MTTDDIARFLRTHPHFFDQHPELLESIHVPHPYGGRAAFGARTPSTGFALKPRCRTSQW